MTASEAAEQASERTSEPTKLDPAFLRMAAVLLLGMLMALLDETIINVGIRTLTATFDSPLATIQWVTAGYLLAVSVAIPFSGWAVDRFGGRNMWLASVTLFVVGSILCGIAWSAESLIFSRVLQGLGGGMVIPVVQSMLARSAPPNLVAKAMGLISIPLVVGPVIGPVLGGLFIDHANWRWMFLVNIQIGVAAVILALLTVPPDRPAGASDRKLDMLGLLLLSPGFAALVYGFTTAAQLGHYDDAEVLIPAGVGIVLLVGYIVHALKTKVEPLIDLKLFRSRGFTLAAVIMFMVGAVANTLLFLTPLYYQEARLFDAVHAGLLLVPSGLVGAFGSVMVGKLAAKYTARFTSSVGLVLMTAGMYVYTWVGPDTSQTVLAIALGVTGFGIGVAIPGTLAFMFNAVGPAAMARATGALFIFNQLGGALGISLVAVTLQSNMDDTDAPSAFGMTYWIVVAVAAAGAFAAAALPGPLKVSAQQGE